ncbi:HxlR family transcriptional regulator [Gordoniibacillus kamchatkensis]|uniref:HxlR family transcriptional regulator n=1 Tax=Gordoniibacillus kamchatkensis TaxID=1590651 RepID=A0ABR5AKR7_9BACL|nr:helix-turn-helix domain-containing protein [Paenibacillus sp. VKM B-2647]KIL41626.1 HxlR family transcriptional regulator [Paenibacillus sp. VKM B-2647]
MARQTAATPAISVTDCAYSRVLEIVSSKWTVLIIFALAGGAQRYGELRRRIADISQKMLTQTLRQLERDGLIKRTVMPAVPPIVEYALTPLGETLLPHIRQMKQWTTDYYPLVEQARKEYDRENAQK